MSIATPECRPKSAGRLSFRDRFLSLWISLAMLLRAALGQLRPVPSMLSSQDSHAAALAIRLRVSATPAFDFLLARYSGPSSRVESALITA